MTAVPPGELLVEPSSPFLVGRRLQPGGDAATGELRVRNISPKPVEVHVRALPSNRDLDRVMRVEVSAGDRTISTGTLGDLRTWTRDGLALDDGEAGTLGLRAWLPEGGDAKPRGRDPRRHGRAAGRGAAMKRALRFARILALWAAIGLFGGVLLAIAIPLAFDARPLTVLSGSMEPTLQTGDVVVAKRVEPRDVRIGDVVTYRSPTRRLVTHRVRALHQSGERFVFVTKGDANNSTERWTLKPGDELSRSVYRIPMAGHVLSKTRLARRKARADRAATPPSCGIGSSEQIWRPGEATA